MQLLGVLTAAAAAAAAARPPPAGLLRICATPRPVGLVLTGPAHPT